MVQGNGKMSDNYESCTKSICCEGINVTPGYYSCESNEEEK